MNNDPYSSMDPRAGTAAASWCAREPVIRVRIAASPAGVAKRRATRLRRCFAWLRQNYPTRKPIYLVVTGKVTRYMGWVDRTANADRMTIFISYRHSVGVQIDTLLHEYAHCLSWRGAHHGVGWERAYGKLYRHWFDQGGYLDAGCTWPRGS